MENLPISFDDFMPTQSEIKHKNKDKDKERKTEEKNKYANR